jgi:hypothetical protein
MFLREKMINQPTIISFGNTPYYNLLALDLLNKIKRKYPTLNYRVFTENDLDDEINVYAKKYNKGYGYWLWKPYIALKTFEKLSLNEILVYIDARCYFMGDRISWLEKFIHGDYDIGVWELSEDQLEYQWTSADVFEFFCANKNVISSPQFASGIWLIRKTKRTIELMNGWFNIMSNFGNLVRNDYPRLEPHKGFIQNKEDQSIFSMLVKSEKYKELNKMIIKYHEMINSKNSLLIDFRMRPVKMARQIDFIRIHFPSLAKILKPLYMRLRKSDFNV